MTFKTAFCERYRCPEEAFEREVFLKCIHRHALLLGALLLRYKPSLFREDMDIIREVGAMRDPHMFTSEMNFFHGRNRRDKSWLRIQLGVRISAKRFIRLKNRVFNTRSR